MLGSIGGELRHGVGSDDLSPHVVRPAILQQMRHLAALQLVDGYLRALGCAARVEVVAVGNGGVLCKGFAPLTAIVAAQIKAVADGADGFLIKHKATHSSAALFGCAVERSFDDAVGDGQVAFIYKYQSRCTTCTIGVAACDVHLADAAGDGGFAHNSVNQP